MVLFVTQSKQKSEQFAEWRTLAHTAYKLAKGDEDKALQLFDTWCDGNKPDHPRRFMRTFGPRTSTKNKAGQGRKPKIPKAEAKKLARIYKQGFKTCGEQRGFRSIAHAKKKSTAFAEILKKCHNPTDETVLSAIKNADPNFKKVRQTAKTTLTGANMSMRRKACDANLRRGVQRLHAVTFMDEFSFTANLPNTMVAGDKRKGDKVVKDRFKTKAHKHRPTVHALIAVNYVKGPIYIDWLTGTSGGVGKVYLVSNQPGCLLQNGHLCEYLMLR